MRVASQAVATPKPPPCVPQATLMRPSCDPHATLMRPQGSHKATQERMQKVECRMQNARKRHVAAKAEGSPPSPHWTYQACSGTQGAPSQPPANEASLRYRRSAPDLAPLYTHLANANNWRKALPLHLWRRGMGRGGPPLSRRRFVATFQRLVARIGLGCRRRTTTSSPCPSPPKVERATGLPCRMEIRVKSSVLGRSRLPPG